MKVISIRLPDWMVEELDNIVFRGEFISRSEAIRYAVRQLIRELRNRSLNQPINNRSSQVFLNISEALRNQS